MTKTIIFDLHHTTNKIVDISRTVDASTEAGRALLIDLATLHDQIKSVSDRIKAI